MNWILLSLICMIVLALYDILGKKAVEAEPFTDTIKTGIWFSLLCVVIIGLIYAFGLSESGDPPWVIAMRIPESFWSAVFLMTGGLVGLWSFRSLGISEKCSINNCDSLFLVLIAFIMYKLTGTAAYFSDVLSPLRLTGIVLVIVSSVLLPLVKGKKAGIDQSGVKQKANMKLYIIDMALCFFAAICDAADDFISGYALNEVVADSYDYLIAYGFWIVVLAIPFYVFLNVKTHRIYNPFRKSERWIILYAIVDVVLSVIYLAAMDAEPIRAPILITAYPVLTFLLSRIIRKERLSLKEYAALTTMTIGAILFAI